MTDITYLETRRTAILTEIAGLENRPSYSIDSHSIDWNGYRRSLYEELELVNKAIAMNEGPIELHTQGFSG